MGNGDIGLLEMLADLAERIILPYIQIVQSKKHLQLKMIGKFMSSYLNYGKNGKKIIKISNKVKRKAHNTNHQL